LLLKGVRVAGQDHNFSVWGFVKGFGKFLIGSLLLIQGLLGLMVMLMIVGVFVSVSNSIAGGKQGEPATIQKDVALVINPMGVLVEEAEKNDPFEQVIQDAYGVNEPGQVEVHQLARVIRKGASDDRVKGLVLDLGGLAVPSSSASKLQYLAREIENFKKAGKSVYAIGDGYSQEQYMLAAHANKIYMHDQGALVFTGYGSYGMYLKSFLEKMMVTPHVFRVGTYKAAVEPFLRDDASPEAKEANREFLGYLWDSYAAEVESARQLDAGAVKFFAENYNEILKAADGDFAKAALDAKFVDELGSRKEQLAAMEGIFGKGKNDQPFKSVGYRQYLAAVGRKDEDKAAPNIAIVTASGTIVDGEAPAGAAAGGDTVAGYLKKALDDSNVKAVVLRVDSPGGSAFASEIIRDAVLDLKAAGKPVVVSMGSLAASGGYWIASAGDEIYASPTTITGSIGIFSFFPTFENAAAYWGVNIDGVGTTPLSSIAAAGLGPLEENIADVLQQSVEKGYRDFLQVVAEGRNLSPEYVDQVGQGRVWIGAKALELKLVDKIGDIDDAVAAAARLANLEEYDRVDMFEEASPFNVILGNLGAEALVKSGVEASTARTGVIARAIAAVEDQAAWFDSFNDPNAAYARCLACEM
jgi:protease-4